MNIRLRVALLAVSLFVVSLSVAVAKKKAQVPDFILKAQTVCVIIDPDAGTSITDPLANKNAQDEVEKALMVWHRFQLVQEPGRADLVIVIRRGVGKPVDRTIGNLPTNDRPITVQQTDNAIRLGGQKGRAPGSPDQTMPQDTRAEQQTEVGPGVALDSFIVYGPGNGAGPDMGSSPALKYPPATSAGAPWAKTSSKRPTSPPSPTSAKPSKKPKKPNNSNRKNPDGVRFQPCLGGFESTRTSSLLTK